jgi:hypothetical protein
MNKSIVFFLLTFATILNAQVDSTSIIKVEPVHKKWFETISIKGYGQVRYNRLLETNQDLNCESCDKSWGKDGGFFIRRWRGVLSGQVSKNVFFYLQTDFSVSPSADKLHFLQVRDAYFDIGLDPENEFKIRIGQSKIPFGFENLQSSQNRLTMDRSDALNSGVPNERDLGVLIYWAPVAKKKLLSRLVSEGLKGSGDYGIIGIGAYNGQSANAPESNNEPHIVARVTYPFEFKNQIAEFSLQGITGQFVVPKLNLSSGVKYKSDLNYLDQRVAATAILYPKPFGIQAEYNIGKGPEYNPITDSIELKSLKGGYVMTSFMTKIRNQTLIPFVKYQYYEGGKKTEKDARSYTVNDIEIGAEWQLSKNFELTINYTISKRRYEDHLKPINTQSGNLLRLQAQVNF